jgi:hypothetical protein
MKPNRALFPGEQTQIHTTRRSDTRFCVCSRG